MTPEEELKRKLKAMFAAPIQVEYAKVFEIDEKEFHATVDVNYCGLETWFVRLQSITGCKSGVKIWPKIGSVVLVGRIGNSEERLILAYSEIDKIEWKIGDQVLVMTKDGFVINGGELGGMIKIEELVNRLNAIENDINNLKQVFTSWTVTPQDGGGALKTASSSWYQQSLEKSQRDPLEDTKVKH